MKGKIIDALSDLAQLDIDAVYAYEEALKNIDDSEIFKNIDSFRLDHLRHIDDLSALIVKQGGTPPKKTKDFKGYIIKGFTSLRSMTGTFGALKAMKENEKTTNKTYKKALDENKDFPPEILILFEANYNDEQKHLLYIMNVLEKQKNSSNNEQV